MTTLNDGKDQWLRLVASRGATRLRARTTPMVAREVAGPGQAELWKVADAAWPHVPEYRAATHRDIPILTLR